MSGDKRYVLVQVPAGSGRVLDLGGGSGALRGPLRERGYAYTNLDLAPRGRGAIVGDAQRAPFAAGCFGLVVAADSLEHFPDPRAAVAEVRRVMEPDGRFVIWVPFLHPFHGDDFWRYTPLGLRTLLEDGGFSIESIQAPLWVASVVAQAFLVPLAKLGMGGLERPLERGAAWIDARLARFQGPDMSFAAAYLVVARPVTLERR